MATEQQLHREFMRAIRDIQDGVKYNALRDAIARGDYLSAIAAVDIDDAAFDGLRAMIMQTYAEGGVNAITGTRWPVNTRWNSATAESEYFARNVVGADITKITDDMRDAVRWMMGDGIALGRSNNRIALDIVGRVGVSGRREGGIVGLNEGRAKWVADYRKKLEQGLGVDNRLVTASERKLIERGNLTQRQIDRMVQSYANRQLLSRGNTIARTERGLALNMGAMEGWRQGAEKSGIPLWAMVKEWRHEGFNRVDRMTHVAANGDKVQGLYTPFNVGGYSCQYPHDPSLPASEVVNCGCRVKVTVPRNWRAISGA